MPSLYHFPTSPFSRRVRLALALKGIQAELKDGRATPAFHDEARAKWPLRTMPVFVTDDGRALGDSTAIVRFLDAAYPNAPRVFPADPDALLATVEITALCDGALDNIVNVGTRYYALKSS